MKSTNAQDGELQRRGYGRQLLAMTLFYIVASVWFAFYRYRFVRRGDQFSMPWPRPQGY